MQSRQGDLEIARIESDRVWSARFDARDVSTGLASRSDRKELEVVRSYVIRDGHLFLSQMADGGIYEFEPTGSSGEGGSLFGNRWRLTEVKGAAMKTTKAYVEFDRETKRVSGDGAVIASPAALKSRGRISNSRRGIHRLEECSPGQQLRARLSRPFRAGRTLQISKR